jgi:CheY-like chemotaxis protein
MPTVLVVDDDTDVREMLELFLTHSGFEIRSAANGAQALERMREKRPCVVLLDLMMPVMTGWQFRERQLEDPALASVPVVVITAAYDHKSVGRQLGLQCLSKPVDLEELVTIVHQACDGVRDKNSAARNDHQIV